MEQAAIVKINHIFHIILQFPSSGHAGATIFLLSPGQYSPQKTFPRAACNFLTRLFPAVRPFHVGGFLRDQKKLSPY